MLNVRKKIVTEVKKFWISVGHGQFNIVLKVKILKQKIIYFMYEK